MKITNTITLEEFLKKYAYILEPDLGGTKFTINEQIAIYEELSTMTEHYEMEMDEKDVEEWILSDVKKIHMDDILKTYPAILDFMNMNNFWVLEAFEHFTTIYNIENGYLLYQVF